MRRRFDPCLGRCKTPIRPNSIGRAFRRLVDCGELSPIRLHDLRDTRASQLLMAGVNVKEVSERLGHASVSFTLDTYGHVMPGQQAEREGATVGGSLTYSTGTGGTLGAYGDEPKSPGVDYEQYINFGLGLSFGPAKTWSIELW